MTFCLPKFVSAEILKMEGNKVLYELTVLKCSGIVTIEILKSNVFCVMMIKQNEFILSQGVLSKNIKNSYQLKKGLLLCRTLDINIINDKKLQINL